jgi:hypothetical protein
MWGKQNKLILWFSIADFGQHHGIRIARYYNVTRIVGKPGKNGAFKLSWSSSLLREYASLILMPTRLDRIYLHHLSSLLIVGMVKTVRKTSQQEVLPEALHYSVVQKLLRVEAGADTQH